MTDINPDQTNPKEEVLSEPQSIDIEKSKRIIKATPNWRKRLRRTAIAAALPLLSLMSGAQMGEVASAMTIPDGYGSNTVPHMSEPAPRENVSDPIIIKEAPKVKEKSTLESHIYENARDNFTYPFFGGYRYGPEEFFQYELGKHLSPEQFSQNNQPELSPEEMMKQMIERMKSIQETMKDMVEVVGPAAQVKGAMDEFRNQDPTFYNSLKQNYINSFNGFNPGFGALPHPSEVRVPKVNALMAEMRLDQMLGGVAKK